MVKFLHTFLFIGLFIVSFKSNGQEGYLSYHSKVIDCETLIAEEKFEEAIYQFDVLFEKYDFVFLRDIKLAVELSVFLKDYKSGIKFTKRGIKAGWTLKSLNKNQHLKSLREQPAWNEILSEYDSLNKMYESRLNMPLKNEVHEMFKKDQKKALGALFRIGQKAQRKYSEKKFAPHSEAQLKKIEQILKEYGYPGEQLIGNNVWSSVILSHHNSISVHYNSQDTLYTQLRPKLLKALEKGEISPYEFAQIEDWRIAALNNHNKTNYGFLGAIQNTTALDAVNKNRAAIGLRSVELRNKLIDIENKTGLNLHLPKGWQSGKIIVNE